MTEEDKKKYDDVQYMKVYKVEETDTPNPIQGPVKDPNTLFHFMRDVHDSTVPKIWGIFLNEQCLSIGNEPLAIGHHAEPLNFETGTLSHFYSLFFAKKFILLTNHTTDDASPSEEDKDLIRRLQNDSQTLSYKPQFEDYIIVAGDHYWSMNKRNGTACHCGQQHYVAEFE